MEFNTRDLPDEAGPRRRGFLGAGAALGAGLGSLAALFTGRAAAVAAGLCALTCRDCRVVTETVEQYEVEA